MMNDLNQYVPNVHFEKIPIVNNIFNLIICVIYKP